MTTPTDRDHGGEDVPRRDRVPILRCDGILTADEYAEVDADVAGQWDAPGTPETTCEFAEARGSR